MAIKPLDWGAVLGQEIRIYRNLNNGTMSIQIRAEKGWRVAGHVIEAVVQTPHFHISESGRQRVIKDRCKNVHAWAQGKLLAQADDSIDAPVDLAYNPYTNESFVERHTQRPISDCQYLVVRENRVFVSSDALPKDSGGRVVKIPQRQPVRFPGMAIYRFAVA